LNVNSFETNLNFVSPQINSNNINEPTQDYHSRYVIPAVSIEEQFSPLVGIDIRTKNDLNLQFEFAKRRGLQFGLTDNTLAENRVTSVQVGFDYVLKDVELKFLPGFKSNREETQSGQRRGGQSNQKGGQSGSGTALKGNDLEFLFDFSISDNITVNHYLDYNSNPQPTRGQKEISISPAVRYNLNKNINLRLFFDYRKTTPYTTTGYPITTTEGGITVQVVLE
jgi:cell surface protein SprA